MVNVPFESLKTIPFLDPSSLQPGRQTVDPTFFVEGIWSSYLPMRNGQIVKVPSEVIEGGYFGDAAESQDDQLFLLLDLIYQRINFREMVVLARAVCSDFRNFATSLAKFDLFFNSASKNRPLVTVAFALTELEYVLMVARSIYDLLHELVERIWKRTSIGGKMASARRLPAGFAKLVLSGDRIKQSEELIRTYGLPDMIANWYVAQAKFFLLIRQLRDKIVHHGSGPIEILFATDRGYAILATEGIWSELHNWPDSVRLPNDLVPLRPAVCAIIQRVVDATDGLAKAIEKEIGIPLPMFPGLHYFFRHCWFRHLAVIDKVLDKSLWCDTSV